MNKEVKFLGLDQVLLTDGEKRKLKLLSEKLRH